jgi:hypothetical protein
MTVTVMTVTTVFDGKKDGIFDGNTNANANGKD